MEALPKPASKAVIPLPGRIVAGVPVRQRRSATKRDLSVLMLLLAAETVACVSHDETLSTDLLGGVMPPMSLSPKSTPQQRAVATMANRLMHASSSSSTKGRRATPVKGKLIGIAAMQDDETTSSCGTGGDTESDETGATTPYRYEEQEEMLTPNVVAKDSSVKVCNLSISSCSISTLPPGLHLQSNERRSNGAALGKNAHVMTEVFSYLSWREVVQLRGVSRDWLRCSLPSATICRLPNSKTRAIFVPCTDDLARDDDALEASLVSGNTHDWDCPMCGMYNLYSRIQCANSTCSTLSPAHWMAKRIFLGQLRRENTVTFVKWLFNHVLDIDPSEALVSVENHRDRETGRGKGCAWVSINKRDNVKKLLSLHHRAFYDLYEDVEGMWIVHPRDVDALAKRTNSIANSNKGRTHGKHASPSGRDWRQHAQHMPRSPIVAEGTVDQESPKALFSGPGHLSLNAPRHYSVDPKREVVVMRHNPYFAPTTEELMWAQQRILHSNRRYNNSSRYSSNNNGRYHHHPNSESARTFVGAQSSGPEAH